MTIKALIFDFDGLIMDTETPELIAWQEVYRRHGAILELSEWLACVGTSQEAFDPIQTLIKRSEHPLNSDAILFEQRELFGRMIKDQEPMPGITGYIAAAKRLDLRLGVASSSTRSWVESFLDQLQLQEDFDCVCTSNDVDQVKPNPALYSCAVSQLDVEPREAIAFEDSYNGLLAAKSAGLYCVAVPNFVTKVLDFSQADLVLTSLEEMPLASLLEKLNGKNL